jgi:hypothetical protein
MKILNLKGLLKIKINKRYEKISYIDFIIINN